MKTVVPIFFSVSDATAPLLATVVSSIKDNATAFFVYQVHVLTEGLSSSLASKIESFSSDNFHINIVNAKLLPTKLENALYLVPELFPQYDKAVWLDNELIVNGNIARLFQEPLGSKPIGSVCSTLQNANPGVLLLNCKVLRARKQDLSEKDILLLDPEWNATASEKVCDLDDAKIIHFDSQFKPWLKEGAPCSDLFWKYAEKSGFGAYIRELRRRKSFPMPIAG